MSANPGPNVDAGEVERFDRLASRWWDPDGESRPLHDLNPLRFSWIAQRIALRGSRALDVGCGGGLDYRQMSVEALADAHAGEFDLVCCMEMLEHVPDSGSVIRACADLLKPGGMLFLSTLNRTPKAFAAAIVGAEYVMRLLPKGTHHYAQFIKPSELAGSAPSCSIWMAPWLIPLRISLRHCPH